MVNPTEHRLLTALHLYEVAYEEQRRRLRGLCVASLISGFTVGFLLRAIVMWLAG
jgi:hypothetical protein